MLLKEYQSSAGQGVIVPGVLIEVNSKTGEQKVSCLGVVEHHYTMNDGFFAGRDQRDLIAEAIAWWETQLTTLEVSACAAAPLFVGRPKASSCCFIFCISLFSPCVLEHTAARSSLCLGGSQNRGQ